MTDLTHDEWYSMETKNVRDGLREIDIFSEAQELIATVYVDAGSKKQKLIARAIENIPEIVNAMRRLCDGEISGADIKTWSACHDIRKLLKRIDGEQEAQS